MSEAKNLAARPFASLRVTIRERALVSQIVESICKVYFLTVPKPVLLCRKILQLEQIFDCYSSWMQHVTKKILTTKITKSGGFETRPYTFCVLCIAMRKNFLRVRKLLSSQSRK